MTEDITALVARLEEAAGEVSHRNLRKVRIPVHINAADTVFVSPNDLLSLCAAFKAMREENDCARQAMADAYQAVGAIGEPFGLEGNEHYIRLLDVLAYQKTEDGKDLLPFPCTVEELAPNAVVALHTLLDKAREIVGFSVRDWSANRRYLSEAEREMFAKGAALLSELESAKKDCSPIVEDV